MSASYIPILHHCFTTYASFTLSFSFFSLSFCVPPIHRLVLLLSSHSSSSLYISMILAQAARVVKLSWVRFSLTIGIISASHITHLRVYYVQYHLFWSDFYYQIERDEISKCSDVDTFTYQLIIYLCNTRDHFIVIEMRITYEYGFVIHCVYTIALDNVIMTAACPAKFSWLKLLDQEILVYAYTCLLNIFCL